MMASLPQTATQTGLATILAALGQTAPAGTGEGGFEQLFASLPKSGPVAAATPGGDIPVAAVPDAALSVTAPAPLPGLDPLLSQPGPAIAVVPAAPAGETVDAIIGSETPVPQPAKAAPAPDAAAAASLLIAVATPYVAPAPTAAKPAPVAETAEDDASDETSHGAVDAAPATVTPIVVDLPLVDAAPPAVPAPVAAPVAIPAAPTPAKAEAAEGEIAETSTPAAIAVAALPNAAPAANKPAKPVTAPIATKPQREDANASAPAPRAAKLETPLPAAIAAAEPRTARPAFDAGAAMTVLFAQPTAQGAALVGGAAPAVPLTERMLDVQSDDQWIAQLAADIAATKSETGDLSFRLIPRNLGRLDVSMKMDEGGVSLKLDTQHEATATIITAAQPRLVEDLRQQGVRVAEAQVTHTPAEAGRQQQQQSQGRQAAPGASHLIETANERPETHDDERTADRRGRFA